MFVYVHYKNRRKVLICDFQTFFITIRYIILLLGLREYFDNGFGSSKIRYAVKDSPRNLDLFVDSNLLFKKTGFPVN